MKALMPCSTRLHVRPGDLDSLGHVNNARALEYLEQGRWDWLRCNGLALKCAVLPVVVRVEADYQAQLLWGDVDVETTLAREGDESYRATFTQSIRQAGAAKAAVRAVVRLAFIDASTGRLCAVEDYLAAASPQALVP